MLGLTASKKKQNITESWNSQEICQPYDPTTQLHPRIPLASPGFTRPKGLPQNGPGYQEELQAFTQPHAKASSCHPLHMENVREPKQLNQARETK